jgi:hypothetical protein
MGSAAAWPVVAHAQQTAMPVPRLSARPGNGGGCWPINREVTSMTAMTQIPKTKALVLSLALLAAAVTVTTIVAPATADHEGGNWVDANKTPCPDVCKDAGGAIASGHYYRSKDAVNQVYFICRAARSSSTPGPITKRTGFNISTSFDRCRVEGFTASTAYQCLCAGAPAPTPIQR